MTTTIERPERTEAAEYYFTYINQVPEGDICTILERQLSEVTGVLQAIPKERELYRYAPDKWSTREVAGHLNDTERLFTFRAFWFARGFDLPLPSFDQHIAAGTAGSDQRPLASHVEEFRAVRAATLTLFQNLPPEAWTRRGTASGNPFSVRALAFIAAGHVVHHLRILEEKYR